MKKKIVTLIAIILIVVMGAAISVFYCTRNGEKEANSNSLAKHEGCDFTRFEWIKLLCEKVGVTDYECEIPYFVDVTKDSEYFNYVQAAVEWELLEDEELFYGDYCVDGEFVAMSAMKTISKEKMEIYLDSDEEITDKKILEVALKLDLVSEEKLDKCYSMIEAQMVIEKLENLYFGLFWKEDYEKIEFLENVTEIFEEEIMEINEDASEIVVSKALVEKLHEGNVVIFDYGNTGLKCARKVTKIEEGGTVFLDDDVAMEDVFETLVVSDVNEMTFADIANYYGVEVQEEGNFVNTKIFDKKNNSNGFKINLEINSDNELSVKIIDNETGYWFEIPLDITLENGVECEVEVDVDKINVGAQVNYKLFSGLKSADVAVETQAKISAIIQGFDVEKKIPLYETVTPIGNGYVGVDIGVYLVLTAEGTIRFEAEIPIEASVNYQKDKGFKNHSFNIDVEKPLIECDCTASASVQLEPTMVVLMLINVADVQMDVGIGAHANVKIRPGFRTCTDISVYYPTFRVSFCGDDDADTLLGLLGVSAEWDIITEDNSPYKMKLHHEILKDGKNQFVDKCTYEEGEEETEVETENETQSKSENISESEVERETETVNEVETTIDTMIENENMIDFSQAYGRRYVVWFYGSSLSESSDKNGWILQGNAMLYDYVQSFPRVLPTWNVSEIEGTTGTIYKVSRTRKTILWDREQEAYDTEWYVLYYDQKEWCLSYTYGFRNGYICTTYQKNNLIIPNSNEELIKHGSILIPYDSELASWLQKQSLDTNVEFLVMFDENGNIDRYLPIYEWSEEKEKEFFNIKNNN